jgi:hypothetical protein
VEAEPTDITHLLDDRNNPPKRCEPDAAGWVPDGRCVAYRDNGSLLLEISYKRGVAHGPYRDYWSDGRLASEGQYVGGVQEGKWRFYHQGPGQAPEVLRFVAGREVVDWDAFFGQSRPEA